MSHLALRNGLIGSFSILLLYVITMTLLSGSWQITVDQFRELWWLMVPLSLGFGIQVGLYTRLKETIKQRAKGSLAAGGTSASLGMLACCAHHATDVLPLVGLSALATLIGQYQVPILVASLGVNLLGIVTMWKQLQKLST